MSEKYPLWRKLREEIFLQLIRDQWALMVQRVKSFQFSDPIVKRYSYFAIQDRLL
jgi:hypothetical protein